MNKSTFICIAAVLLLAAVSGFRFFSGSSGFLERIGSTIVYPFLSLQSYSRQALVNYRKRHTSHAQLLEQLATLKQEKAALEKELVIARSTATFMQETKGLQEFARRYDTSYQKLCSILLHDLHDDAQSILVDAGSNDGVELDMVAVYQASLIGKVVQVFPRYSKVMLITDPSCRVAAYCTSTDAHGVFEGNPRGGCLNFVSHLEDIQPNDLILSSGKGILFPKGFGLGRVKHAEIQDLAYSIEVKPLVDITAMNYCYIITS